MENFINSFKANLYERASSPVLGYFIFYWLICNYKLVMIILDGDMKIKDKLDLIKEIYPQNIVTFWDGFDIHYSTLLGNGLLIPLLITLVYIFIIPYPAKYIYTFWKNRQKELLIVKHNIDEENPISGNKAKKLRRDFYELQKKYESQFEEITNLKSLINSSEELPNIKEENNLNNINNDTNTNKEVSKVFSSYKDLIIDYLELTILEKCNEGCTVDDISSISEEPDTLESKTQELLKKKLIKFDKEKEIFIITDKGIKAIEKCSFKDINEDEIPF